MTDRILTIADAVALADVVRWVQCNARLRWLDDRGEIAEGTARSIGGWLYKTSAVEGGTDKFNPDPAATVYWGPQNWDEMQSSFLGFLIPSNTDVSRILRPSGASLRQPPISGAGPTLSMVGLPK
jgi:hypothetical protein